MNIWPYHSSDLHIGQFVTLPVSSHKVMIDISEKSIINVGEDSTQWDEIYHFLRYGDYFYSFGEKNLHTNV